MGMEAVIFQGISWELSWGYDASIAIDIAGDIAGEHGIRDGPAWIIMMHQVD